MKKEDVIILAMLRRNAKCSLNDISNRIGISKSTIYDKIKRMEKKFIEGYAALLNFSSFGYNTRAFVSVKVPNNNKVEFMNYISDHDNINSLFKINNGYDFMFEIVFKTMKELDRFLDNIEVRFNVKAKHLSYVIEDIKRECFMRED